MFPLLAMIPVRENSEVVMKFTQILWNICEHLTQQMTHVARNTSTMGRRSMLGPDFFALRGSLQGGPLTRRQSS